MKLAIAVPVLIAVIPSVGVAQVTLTTDRDSYIIGEFVEFSFHNGSDHPVEVPP